MRDGAVVVRRLRRRDRPAALAYLAREPAANLMLLDLAAQLGGLLSPGAGRSALFGGFRDDVLAGVLSVRPSVLADAGASAEVLAALAPQLESVRSGLIRCPAAAAEPLWRHLEKAGRRALVDRREASYRLALDDATVAGLPSGGRARRAQPGDLEDLVVAARASLREEGRPDPFRGDPDGFRAWVRGRLDRARVLEQDGRTVFVAYADVQRPEGWLLQGVYTWPESRRRGFARAGVAALCRRAHAAGAEHVQLAVVEGNAPAERLYAGLGFEPFQQLRTILFA